MYFSIAENYHMFYFISLSSLEDMFSYSDTNKIKADTNKIKVEF